MAPTDAPSAASSADVRLEIVGEEEVADTDRKAVAALLRRAFGAERVQEGGYTYLRPEFRVLARADGTIVGARSVCRPACTPPVRLYGFSDCAVDPAWRGRGIARSMIGEAIAECERREAEAMLCCTVALAGVYRSYGFEPVHDSRRLRVAGEERPRVVDWLVCRLRPPSWYVRWAIPPVPLRLESRF